MTLAELILIAIGLSMDAFAVSICKGLSVSKIKPMHFLTVGIYFGGFQALMPLLGYIAGFKFQKAISKFDYIIAFILLAIIGANMIKEALANDEYNTDNHFSPSAMLPLAIATSIDALAVGVTFAALGCTFYGTATENIFFDISVIGITTFVISSFGIKIGNIFGIKYKSKAEIAGGIILILIGLKIFISHFC